MTNYHWASTTTPETLELELECWPMRGQYPGHVTTLDQSELVLRRRGEVNNIFWQILTEHPLPGPQIGAFITNNGPGPDSYKIFSSITGNSWALVVTWKLLLGNLGLVSHLLWLVTCLLAVSFVLLISSERGQAEVNGKFASWSVSLSKFYD